MLEMFLIAVILLTLYAWANGLHAALDIDFVGSDRNRSIL